MRYDKLRGTSLGELLSDLRERFGKDVYVLNTRELKEGGVLGTGLFSKKVYEVEYMVKEDHAPFHQKQPALRSGGVHELAGRSSTVQARPDAPARMIGSTATRAPEVKLPVSQMQSDTPVFDLDNDFDEPDDSTAGQNSHPGKQAKPKILDDDSFAELDRLIMNLKKAGKKHKDKPNDQAVRKVQKVVEELANSQTAETEGLDTLEGIFDSSPPDAGTRNQETRQQKMDKAIGVMHSLAEGKPVHIEPAKKKEETFPIVHHPTADELEALWSEDPDIASKVRRNKIEIIEDDAPVYFHKIKTQLLKCRFSEEYTGNFLHLLDDTLSKQDKKIPSVVREKAEKLLKSKIHLDKRLTPPAGDPKAVFLIGPPGSGKTTSLAKLAARLVFQEDKDISLYSIDRYRIGATEQLKHYAKVFDVPFSYPSKPDKFAGELSVEQSDVVFVDTSGISYCDEKRLKQLEEFIAACPLDMDIHLTLAANTDAETVKRTCEAFSTIGFDKILPTRLDETEFLGALIESADKFHRPFSYLMNGQDVPHDILDADAGFLARMVLDA